jgi:tetratricopeptide (TPR) repeat protein
MSSIHARIGLTLLLAASMHLPMTVAQEARPPRLIDEPPHDVITLDKANDNKVIKIEPLDLPGRRVPDKPRPTDKLRIKLLDGGEQYDVAWQNIEKLELFEQLVLAEAGKLTADGQLDDAYEALEFLFNFYPQTPGLNEARQNFLYVSSAAAFRQAKYDEALAILEELLEKNPGYRASAGAPTLLQTLGNITERIVARSIEQEDYQSARLLVSRLAKQYKAENEPFVQRARQRMIDLAAQRRDEAQAFINAGRYAEARDAAARMRQIWPDLAGGAELTAELARRHPQVIVGVEHPALALDARSLHNVSARRSGRLTQRLLAEFSGPGPEGGRYVNPLGTFTRSDDSRELLIDLGARAGDATGLALTQALLGRAAERGPSSFAPWGRVVAAVRLQSPTEVVARFHAPHLLPAALLQFPLADLGIPAAPYEVLSHDEAAVRYTASPDYALRRPGQPAEVIERHFDDPQRALTALKRGEIDLVDRVFPGDVAALKSDDGLVVTPYAAPTTHVLAVRSRHAFLASATFRRALLYGSNREALLSQGLLRGRTLPGFRVVSSPFPAPTSRGDTSAYGYDAQIEPRPYDPRLGLTLRLLAAGELKAAYEKRKQKAPELTPITLGHPADEISRIACRGLVKQWKQIGVECKLVEFPPGVFDDTEAKCDLVYLQLAAVEPLIDAGRLLGREGLVPADNATIQLTLQQIEQARNWQQARERLLMLHRLVHEDVTLLPLWQTHDHFAYRRTLQGVTSARTALYQDIEQWQLAPALARTQP